MSRPAPFPGNQRLESVERSLVDVGDEIHERREQPGIRQSARPARRFDQPSRGELVAPDAG